MTTQLVWKSCEFSNTFYLSILRYHLPITVDVKLEQVVTKQSKSTVFFFSFYLLHMTIGLICSIDIIFETCISKTIKMPLSYLLIEIFLFALLALCLLILLILIPGSKYFASHFLSVLLSYEKKLLDRPNFSEAKPTFAQLFAKVYKLKYLIQVLLQIFNH